MLLVFSGLCISSDHLDLKVIQSYGVLQHYLAEPSRLTARRAFFLIDQEGIVRQKWLLEVQAALFSSDPILEKVREIMGNPSTFWRGSSHARRLPSLRSPTSQEPYVCRSRGLGLGPV
jgi:hypothetical protein